jgi:chromosome segregation ATPase
MLQVMPSQYDPSDFVDSEYEAARRQAYAASAAVSLPSESARAPTREELDVRVSETQRKLAELKRAQEELERERAQCEESRRRQMEFQTGREEMIHHLTRGLGLLEEAEFNARRDAEQMAQALAGLRDALEKVQAINHQTWTKDNYSTELTRALTAIENARMEWNTARLKFAILSAPPPEDSIPENASIPGTLPGTENIRQLCKVGLALTWPLVLLGLAIFLVLLLR